MQVNCFILVDKFTVRVISDQLVRRGHQRGVILKAAPRLHGVECSSRLISFPEAAHLGCVDAVRQGRRKHGARVAGHVPDRRVCNGAGVRPQTFHI